MVSRDQGIRWGFQRREIPTLNRFLVWGLLPLLMAAAGWRVLQQFNAAQAARPSTPEGLAAALRWDSQEPGYPFRLGVMYRDAPELRDLEKARTYLEKAIELNPYNWRYQRELAQLYELAGLQPEAEAAFVKAVNMNPLSGSYRWRLANFYLRSGSLDRALPHVKTALAADRQLLSATPGLLLKAGASFEQVDQLWPDDPAAWREMLRVLSRPQTGSMEDSALSYLETVWSRLLEGAEPLTFADGMVYIQRLIADEHFEDARQRWIELSRSHGVVDGRFESEDTYVWNGGFESPLTRTGLGWQVPAVKGLTASLAESRGFEGSTATPFEGSAATPFEGSAALRIEFDGSQNLSFLGAQQQIVVVPGRTYQLSCYLRSEDLRGGQGAYIEVVDGGSGHIVLATEPVLGSTPWKAYSGSFQVTKDTHWVLLRFSRRPSLRFDNLFRGVLWIDKVSLESVNS